MIIVCIAVGVIAAALAFQHTRSGKLHLGEGCVMVMRVCIGVCVLLGFIALGFKLEGHEVIGGSNNTWWHPIVFWGLAAFCTYTIYEHD